MLVCLLLVSSAAQAAEPRRARVAPCHTRPGEDVVASTPRAVITVKVTDDYQGTTSETYFSCWKPTRRRTLIASGSEDPFTGTSRVQQVRLGGRFAAFFTTSQYRDSFAGSVQEFDIATGKRILHVTRGSTDRSDGYGTIFAPDVVSLEARHGFLAWRAVESRGPYVRHVVITVHDSLGNRIVDDVDDTAPSPILLTAPVFPRPGSSVLRWTHDGQDRVARLG